ncbi:MAG: Dna2/Cas4 domain-containing protein, partial [Alistipes sp.]|nr:Dna2/Cas4 domain-containing protein [Alistipes sp.]
SRFAESYYQEQALSYVDNLNMLYVALTRAKHELHLIVAPPAAIGSSGKVNAVIEEALVAMESEGKIAPAELSEQENKTYEKEEDEFDYSDIGFPTTLPWDKIRIKFSTERYMDDGEVARLHPLNVGIMLHKIFSQALTEEEIFSGLELALKESSISEEEFAVLDNRIRTALANPKIAEWFNGKWRTVRNEHQILLPTGESNRPDRVMISENKCVVVDYKFGHRQDPSHQLQVEGYMDLLGQMGYEKTEGYIWYVTLGEVVEVKPR